MKDSLLVSEEWCSIVFDGRHCEYGAYELRSSSGRRYRRALMLMFEIIFIVADVVIVREGVQAAEMVQELMEAQKELQQMQKLEDREVKYVATGRRAMAGTTPNPQKDVPEISDFETVVSMTGIAGPDDAAKYIESAVIDMAQDHYNNMDLEAEGVHVLETELIDGKPEFINGGDKGFIRWLDEHCAYPNNAIQSKLQGEIVVTFVVDTEGRVVDVVLEKRSNSVLLNGIVQEAMALMQKEVMWRPGVRNGQRTNCKIRVPVVYQLK